VVKELSPTAVTVAPATTVLGCAPRTVPLTAITVAPHPLKMMIAPRIKIIKTFRILILLFIYFQNKGIVVVPLLLDANKENPFCPDRKAKAKTRNFGDGSKSAVSHLLSDGTFRTVPKVPLAGKGMTIANLH
jgi:hypothetical protein